MLTKTNPTAKPTLSSLKIGSLLNSHAPSPSPSSTSSCSHSTKTSPSLCCFSHQDIEAKKEAQKEKEIDEQEANASSMQRCRALLDKDLINTGIYESAGKQSLPLVQLVQQLLRYCPHKSTLHSSLH